MENAPQNNIQSLPKIAAMRNKVQILLAIEAAKEAHPDLGGSKLKSLAMKEWVGNNPDSSDSLAAHFGDYVSTHEHEQCDLSDSASVKNLLEKVRKYKQSPDTLH